MIQISKHNNQEPHESCHNDDMDVYKHVIQTGLGDIKDLDLRSRMFVY